MYLSYQNSHYPCCSIFCIDSYGHIRPQGQPWSPAQLHKMNVTQTVPPLPLYDIILPLKLACVQIYRHPHHEEFLHAILLTPQTHKMVTNFKAILHVHEKF